jgi:hypothetical protein
MSLASLPGGHQQWPEYLAERTRLYPRAPPVPVVLDKVRMRVSTKKAAGRPTNIAHFLSCGVFDPDRASDVDLNVVGPISSTCGLFPHATPPLLPAACWHPLFAPIPSHTR